MWLFLAALYLSLLCCHDYHSKACFVPLWPKPPPQVASLCVMTQALTWGKCRHSSHKLSQRYSDSSHGARRAHENTQHRNPAHIYALTYCLLLVFYSQGMSCPCRYNTIEQLKFPTVRCSIISHIQGAPPALLPAKDTARWELQPSDWIWHWSIIREKPFEWSSRGKERERWEDRHQGRS